MKNLVVAKYLNGRIIKGFTRDFSPKQLDFHIIEDEESQRVYNIEFSKLKAVFFVKSIVGNKDYSSEEAGQRRNMYGKQIEVEFFDGEIIRGYTQLFNPKLPGFFIFPEDKNSNNDRIFINRLATRAIRMT